MKLYRDDPAALAQRRAPGLAVGRARAAPAGRHAARSPTRARCTADRRSRSLDGAALRGSRRARRRAAAAPASARLRDPARPRSCATSAPASQRDRARRTPLIVTTAATRRPAARATSATASRPPPSLHTTGYAFDLAPRLPLARAGPGLPVLARPPHRARRHRLGRASRTRSTSPSARGPTSCRRCLARVGPRAQQVLGDLRDVLAGDAELLEDLGARARWRRSGRCDTARSTQRSQPIETPASTETLGQRRRQDLVAVGVVLLGEELPRGHRDDAGADALGRPAASAPRSRCGPRRRCRRARPARRPRRRGRRRRRCRRRRSRCRGSAGPGARAPARPGPRGPRGSRATPRRSRWRRPGGCTARPGIARSAARCSTGWWVGPSSPSATESCV